MPRNSSKYNQYMKKYVLDRYHRRRTLAIEHLGGKCVCCGATTELELDHIEHHLKSFAISKLWSVSEERFLLELNKCQLLCASCHKLKTSAEGSLLDYSKNITCICGKTFDTIKTYAGHRRWCDVK